jgi:hypothetical protein
VVRERKETNRHKDKRRDAYDGERHSFFLKQDLSRNYEVCLHQVSMVSSQKEINNENFFGLFVFNIY